MRPPPPAVGSHVDGFEVVGILGRGACGVVYQVRDPDLDRCMAMKLLCDDGDAESRARFSIEAKAAARVIHPNVVQVYGVGSHEGQPYILQELVDGVALSGLLETRGWLSVSSVVEVGLQAAQGLAEAARMGVLHRDVKPHNLLLNEAGLVKLADFGLARLLNAPGGLTETGTTLGTPHYMSPEQALGAPQDHRSDQYSLGATLYHLLAGHPPYEDANVMRVLHMHGQAELPPLLEARPDCSVALAGVVQRMLSKVPDDRFEDFEQIVDVLDELCEDAGALEVRTLGREPRVAVEVVNRREATWRTWGLSLVAGVAALAVVGVAQFLARRTPVTTGPTEIAAPVAPGRLRLVPSAKPSRDPFDARRSDEAAPRDPFGPQRP